MNPFKDLMVSARGGGFADTPRLQALLRNPLFAQMTEFGSERTQDLEVQCLHFLLERLPLHPEEAPRMLAQADRGLLRLDFLEISNPIPLLMLYPDHPAIAGLKAAMERNVRTPQFRAAKSLLKWKSLDKTWARFRWENAVRSRYRESLDWPQAADFREDRSAAKAREDACVMLMHRFEWECRQRRQTRMQRIRELAGVTGSYYALLQAMALQVVEPALLVHELAETA